MKKFGQIAIAAIVAATVFTACKKNHTCDCNVKVEAYTEGDSTSGIITVEAQDTMISYGYDKMSKSDAQNRCDASEASLSTTYKAFFEEHASVACELN